MIHFSRLRTLNTLNTILAGGAMLAAGTGPLLHSSTAGAQFLTIMQDSPAYLQHSSQGYLGVTLQDVDNDRAVALKLKEVKGAEIITVDHDAPAGKAGLQSHDVILQMNGQAIEGAEQLRRMLREMPPGRAVSFVLSRDGQPVNLSAQLVDRRDLDREIWGKHVNQPEADQEPPSSGFFNDRTPGARGFLDVWPMGASNLSVGAVVDPLTAQLADYFGATEGTGLLVKSVDGKSPAAVAGLKAGDIVLKVNDDTMATRADWQRILRANEGKQVQVTVLRDKKQQLLTMQAGNPKGKSSLEMPEIFSPELSAEESREMVAELRESLSEIDPDAIAAQVREQARAAVGNIDIETLRKQAEQAMKSVDVDALRTELQEAVKNQAKQTETTKKQLEEMKQQLEQSLPQ